MNFLDGSDAFESGVIGNGLAGQGDGFADNVDAKILFGVGSFEGAQGSTGIQESTASSDDDTFLDGSLGGAEGVLDSILNFSDLHLRGSSDLEDADSSSQFGQSLLKFFFRV